MSQSEDTALRWPCWLPRPSRSGYTFDPRKASVDSTMEVGTLVRREFDADQGSVTCSMLLDQNQMAMFEAFERDTLCQGRGWFLFPLWVGGQLQEYMVRFNGRPKPGTVRGLYTTVTFSLDMGARQLPEINFNPNEREELPVWPKEMPGLQKEGYGYELTDFKLDQGIDVPGVKRVDFEVDEVKITGRMILNPQEAGYFEAFERDVLNQGCRWFLLPVWISGELKEYKVRFKERPKLAEVRGKHSIYTFTLEMGQRSLWNQTVVGWLLTMSPAEIELFADKLHEIVHVKLPRASKLPDGLMEV
ncbi:MAG: hypothetical protein LBV80_07790 [Deltaproteobacteria bacterium]|jgi:hypothetical protein|nr:hypothetical protein [Deltaproteobacteria bacterium]